MNLKPEQHALIKQFSYITTVEEFIWWHTQADEMPTPIREEYLGWKKILNIN